MNFFLKSVGVRVAKAKTKKFVEPHGDEDSWSEATTKDYEANVKAKYTLTQVLNGDNLSCVINYKFAYEVWNDLIVTHEGTSQVKRSKVDLLHFQAYKNSHIEKEQVNFRSLDLRRFLMSNDKIIPNVINGYAINYTRKIIII